MIEDVQLMNSHFMRTYISATVGRKDAQAEHRQILEACAARDSRRALRLLEAHIEHTRSALQRKRGAMRRPGSPTPPRRADK
jgi:DNA-binding GntR family transcriptional regulator